MTRRKSRSWVRRHSLSLVAAALPSLWLFGYTHLDPKSHLGSFCGNAIADWSGSLVIILGTKFLYEIGSAESRPVRGAKYRGLREFLYEHSLLLFIIITGIGWAILL